MAEIPNEPSGLFYVKELALSILPFASFPLLEENNKAFFECALDHLRDSLSFSRERDFDLPMLVSILHNPF